MTRFDHRVGGMCGWLCGWHVYLLQKPRPAPAISVCIRCCHPAPTQYSTLHLLVRRCFVASGCRIVPQVMAYSCTPTTTGALALRLDSTRPDLNRIESNRIESI